MRLMAGVIQELITTHEAIGSGNHDCCMNTS